MTGGRIEEAGKYAEGEEEALRDTMTCVFFNHKHWPMFLENPEKTLTKERKTPPTSVPEDSPNQVFQNQTKLSNVNTMGPWYGPLTLALYTLTYMYP